MPSTRTLNGTTYDIPGGRWESRPIMDLLSVVNGMSTGSADGANILAVAGSTAASLATIVLMASNGLGWGLSLNSITGSYSQSTHAHDFAATDHTHSGLYIPLGDSTAYQTATLANTFLTTAAGTEHTHSDLYIELAGSSAYQTATLAGTFAQTGHTHSNLYIPLGDSTAYQTATLATKFLTTGAASDHSHGNPTLALTNLTGTTASASGGFTLSLSAAAPGAGGGAAIRGSGTYSQNTGTVQFQNSNGITFGLSDNGVMTAAHNAITTGAASDHTHSDLYIAIGDSTAYQTGTLSSALMPLAYSSGFQTGTLSSALMPLAYSSGFQTATLSNTFLTTAANSTHSHGNPTLALTNLSGTTASASNGMTISLAAAAPGGGMTGSVFHLMDAPIGATSGVTMLGKSSCIVQPFFLPQAMSCSYVRLPVSISLLNSGSATTAARSWTFQQTDTYWAKFFSAGVGANSRSLQYVCGSAATLTMRHMYQIGAASNNQTHSFEATFPYEGLQSSYADNNNVASASFTFHTTNRSKIFGYRWLDVPFESSLSAGAWWIQLQRSSATATTTAGGNWAQLTNLSSNMQMVGVSQVNVSIQPLGFASNSNTNVEWEYGAGMWTTNTNGMTTGSMALSHISGIASRPIFPIILMRQA